MPDISVRPWECREHMNSARGGPMSLANVTAGFPRSWDAGWATWIEAAAVSCTLALVRACRSKCIRRSRTGAFLGASRVRTSTSSLELRLERSGTTFAARLHRYRSIFGQAGSSVFPEAREDLDDVSCLLNSSKTSALIGDLNPSVNFQVSDVNRASFRKLPCSNRVYSTLRTVFTEHESHREASTEFVHPGSSPWTSAVTWAQQAVDQEDTSSQAEYNPVYVAEPATDHLSFAIGVSLGRFG